MLSDKIDFKTKTIIRDKKRHYIMIKDSSQEDITIINIYMHATLGAPWYIRQPLTNKKGEINSNTIIVGNFNIPLSWMDRSSRQKIKKEMQALNDILDEFDLIDIYRAFHLKAAGCTFF